MYISLKDFTIAILKALIWTFIIVILSKLLFINYNIGVAYCNFMNIPKDLTLTIMSIGMANEICLLLFVVELIILYLIVKNLKKIRYIDYFIDFISLEN